MKFFSFVRGKIKNMKKGTKIGWLLVALSIVLSVWVIIAQSSKADVDNSDFTLTGNAITGYDGPPEVSGMPENALSIEPSAFADRKDITSVHIGDTITHLSTGCFAGSDALGKVWGGKYDSVPDSCFYNCGSLYSCEIPDTVTYIGQKAFYGTSISGITIPAGVTGIASDAFDEAYNLTNIAVKPGGYYSSQARCLYNKNGSNLIRVPCGLSEVEIPDTVTSIGENAFYGCYRMSEVKIPDSVEHIASTAFEDSSITKIIGSSGSEAQAFAENEGINFEPIYDPSHPDPDPKPEPEPEPKPDPSSSSSSSAPQSSSQQPGSQDPGSQDPGSQDPGSQGGTTPGGNTGGGTNTGGNADNGRNTGGGGKHTPDVTPKTADGDIDPRLIIAIAVFAAGLSLIIVGRRKKAVIVKKGRENRLDD